jgi:ABC-type multidrug transport system fused ATPase/permease subunit
MTPTSAGSSSNEVTRQLASLGTGTAQDRLGFREVINIFWRSFPLLRPVFRHLLIGVVVGVVGGVMGFFLGLLVYDALWQGVLQGKPVQAGTAKLLFLDPALVGVEPALSAAARTAIRDRLIWGGLAFLPFATAIGAAGFYYAIWILQRINQHLRVQLMERLQTLSLRFHSENKVGDAIYRIYQDSAMVTSVIRLLILEPLRYFIVGAPAVYAIVTLDYRLGAILVGMLVPSLALGYLLSGRMRVGFRNSRETASALTSRIQESISGIRVIKAFGAEEREQERFERASTTAFGAAYVARNRLAGYGVALFWFSGSTLLFATYLATLQTMDGASLTGIGVSAVFAAGVWNLAIYNVFKGRGGTMTESIEGLFSLWGRVQDVAIGLDRVYEVLDRDAEIVQAANPVPMPAVRSGIRFDHVTFGYRRGEPILRKVDLLAKPGTITALIGPTGSGKSTLMTLLLRLYEPDEGRIEIDGVDLRQIDLDGLRGGISIALQENLLFRATIRENIRFAMPGASDEQVVEAACVACADAFIRALPLGYDTPLGERGTKLSTGQRQRLSIARAVLKDTPVLILDEPTASLDAETELAVLDNLVRWGKGRAIFIITHRLSTIRRADRIAVLRDGEIVEQGSHDELMRRQSGLYRRLVEVEDSAARASVGA